MTIDLAKLRAETLALIDGTIPGPWFLSGPGRIVRAPDGESEPWSVAKVHGYCGYGEDTSDANARLIAAAPTLAADTLPLLDEIERLKGMLNRQGVGPAERYWEGRWRSECAENERLRGALAPIVNHPLFHDREYLSQELNEKLDAARAALAEGDPA